jgi:hypothetical protein
MARNFIEQYTFNIALALDQYINTLLLGDPDDSLSGRCGRAEATGKPKWFVKIARPTIDFIFLKLFKQVDHCKSSIELEENLGYELWLWSKE